MCRPLCNRTVSDILEIDVPVLVTPVRTSELPIDINDNSGVGGGNGFNTGGNGNNFNRPDKISNPYKAGVVAANPNPQCQLLIGQSALVGGVTVNGIAPASLGTPGDVFKP